VHNWQELGPATIVAGQQTVRYRWEGVEFDGTYDPAMGVFSRFDQTIERQFDEFRRPTEEGSTEYSKQVAHGTAVPASGGGADATVRLTYGPIMSRQKIMAPAAENQPPAPLFEFAYEVDSAAADVHLEGLRSRRILDLWAGTLEAVAGPGLAAEKPRWEALIREALPIFQKVEQSGSVQRLQVHTGIGDFELERMALRLATTGLVPEGSMSMSINASGFTFPTPVLPTWSVGLVPTAMDFNFGASGYDVESLVLQLVSQIQLDRTPMMTPQDWQTVLSRAASEGGVSLTLEPSRLTSPLFDIDVKGALAFNGPLPTGQFEVVARGLPQVMEALQEAQGDPAAGQALAKLSTAQAIGKPGPDGGTVWQIELLPTGKVLVNGWDLASPAQ
jgi:hypothetical protein